MHEFSVALQTLITFFKEENISYMIIGGIANLVWGESRLTEDIDVTIKISDSQINKLIDSLENNFRIRVNNPKNFVKKTRVIPAEIKGIKVDLILAGISYEDQAIERAVNIELSEVEFKVASPEDLVIHKGISERPRDMEDISGILLRQGLKLDKKYILHWLSQFSATLNRPIDKNFEELWNKLVADNQ